MLASLNHPNIGAIYGFEESEGVRALILELVEGDTLAERIARGAVTLSEAIRIAKQVVAALDIAHGRRIVHRDLKPANIKLTLDGTVKVLDFGLAKAVSDTDRRSAAEATTTANVETRDALIRGTAAYMSPEQARGQELDKRTDIWSFGCVLFEMLAGHSPFAQQTPSDTIAAILEREPEWTMLPAGTPNGIRALLRRCLQKEARQRLRDIGDAAFELESADGER